MTYQSELEFLKSFLKNCHLNYLTWTNKITDLSNIDLSLRAMLGLSEDYTLFKDFFQKTMQPNCMYQITDEYSCIFYFIPLPDTGTKTVLSIGPFMKQSLSQQTFASYVDKFSILPEISAGFENYFSLIPVIHEDAALLTLLHTFGEKIWGDMHNFTFEILEHGLKSRSHSLTLSTPAALSDTSYDMHALELRYATEKELFHAVSQGFTQKAEALAAHISVGNLEQRSTDFLQNAKNYSIVLNTLLRKAAELGSVHPYHIDRLSSDFARKIENLTSLDACTRLHRDMIRKYSLLVRNHSTRGYSFLIQKVITCIDLDITADLSLNAFAQLLNVNPSYLSNLFKKETGSTLTDYVNRRRIDHAILLLNSTSLQIQTIAQYCGIPDVNYFSKLFKKYIQKTPMEYRKGIMAV